VLLPITKREMSMDCSRYLDDTFEAIVVAGRAGYKVEEIGATITPRVSG